MKVQETSKSKSKALKSRRVRAQQARQREGARGMETTVATREKPTPGLAQTGADGELPRAASGPQSFGAMGLAKELPQENPARQGTGHPFPAPRLAFQRERTRRFYHQRTGMNDQTKGLQSLMMWFPQQQDPMYSSASNSRDDQFMEKKALLWFMVLDCQPRIIWLC